MMSSSVVRHLTNLLLKLAATISPAESREWRDALAAEVQSISHPPEALQWALGGLSFAFRTRVRSLFWRPIPMDRPTVAFMLAFAIVVGCVALLPGFRDAAAIIPRTATLTNDHRVVSKQMSAYATKAEETGDTRALAFAAMEMDDAPRAMRLANRAIAIDPQLSWVKYFVIQQDWRFDLLRSTFGKEAIEVAEADPDNALGHLLVAESIRRSDRSLTHHRAEWEAAMALAFDSPRYDDYLNRKFELERSIVRENHMGPLLAMYSVSGITLGVEELKPYAEQLLSSGDRNACLRVLRFTSMLQQGQETITTYIARDLNARASAELAKDLKIPEVRQPVPTFLRPANLESFILTDALIVQVAFDIACLMAFVLLASATMILLGNRKRILLKSVRISSAIGITAVVASTLAYLPFASAYSQYLQAANAGSAFQYLLPFECFGIVGNSAHYWFTGPAAQYFFWMLVIASGLALVMWRGILYFIRTRVRTV